MWRADPDTKPIQWGPNFEFKTSGVGANASSNPSDRLADSIDPAFEKPGLYSYYVITESCLVC